MLDAAAGVNLPAAAMGSMGCRGCCGRDQNHERELPVADSTSAHGANSRSHRAAPNYKAVVATARETLVIGEA